MVTNKCLFPHELNFAIKQMELDFGNRLLASQELLKNAEAVLPGMDDLIDQGNDILDNLLAKNGAGKPATTTSETNTISSGSSPSTTNPIASDSAITSSADIPKQFGLLPDKPTTEEQEKFLFNAGISLFDNIWYLDGSKSPNFLDRENIEILRKLYLSLGKDLKKTDEILKNSKKTVFIYDSVDITSLPKKARLSTGLNLVYSVDDLRTLLNENQLTNKDVVYTIDGQTLVLRKKFKSQDFRLPTYKDPDAYKTITNCFHMNGVDNSVAALNRYRGLCNAGNLIPKSQHTYVPDSLATNEFNSIVDGTDFVISNSVILVDKINEIKTGASDLIAKIDFAIDKKYRTYKEISDGISALLKKHIKVLALSLFKVSQTLPREIQSLDTGDYTIVSTVLSKLREKHTDDKIIYLLERRPEIKGFYFDPPDDIFMSYISRVLAANSPGSTSISNEFINNQQQDPFDQYTLLKMYANLIDASIAVNSSAKDLAASSSISNPKPLSVARQSLERYIGTEIGKTIKFPTFQGQPSMATPSTIVGGGGRPNKVPVAIDPGIGAGFDVGKTMDLPKRKQDVYGTFQDLKDIYPPEVAGALADIIGSAADFFEKAFLAIDKLIAQAENTLFAMKKRLDSWLSKHASLTGMGDFNSSLLKCAINWDVGLSTDLLNMLFDFLLKFVAQVLEFLTKFKAWITDIITKLICFPVNLINAFLGAVSVSLPSACRLPRMDLGANLNNALFRLLNCASTKSIVLQSMSKDLLRLKLNVSAAPDRLGQFQSSAICGGSSTSGFMNASMMNINVGVGL